MKKRTKEACSPIFWLINKFLVINIIFEQYKNRKKEKQLNIS